ncbi:MAG: response regulator transcription factor [Sphingobium sp.]
METQGSASLVVGNGLTREGLKHILLDSGFDIVQAVSDIDCLDDQPDLANHVIVVDHHAKMGDIDHVVAAVHEQFLTAKIVILNDDFDFDIMRRAFEAGVAGYILKDVSHESFVTKIKLTLMDERVAPSRLIDMISSSWSSTSPTREKSKSTIFNLTAREQDILDRLVLGQPNKLISRELQISEATVKVGLRTIFRKLAVKNRTQAALKARNAGLMSLALLLHPLVDMGGHLLG